MKGVYRVDKRLNEFLILVSQEKVAGHDKRDQKVRRKQERAGADADTVAALSAAAMAQRERKRKKVARSIAQASSGH